MFVFYWILYNRSLMHRTSALWQVFKKQNIFHKNTTEKILIVFCVIPLV